jgi:hypothetical protein
MNIVYLFWNFTPENALSLRRKRELDFAGEIKTKNPHHDWQGF